ncbi:MAG TPA: recombinase family protein [Roseomonas sp.]|jgi:DNA invertase Pin-like site-specific DNA recombinase
MSVHRKYVSYLRVSTDRQGKSGLGLEAQREAVRGHMAGGASWLCAEFVEVESGKRNERPQLAKALAACKAHGATLIIARLDRLARNVAFVSNLMESGVEFVACDFPSANRLTVHILAAVAEHEGRMISERTKAALAAAKARGVKMGGHRGKVPTAEHRMASAATRAAKAQERARSLAPVVAELREAGHTSLERLAAAMTERRIATARGQERWSPEQVRRLLARI